MLVHTTWFAPNAAAVANIVTLLRVFTLASRCSPGKKFTLKEASVHIINSLKVYKNMDKLQA